MLSVMWIPDVGHPLPTLALATPPGAPAALSPGPHCSVFPEGLSPPPAPPAHPTSISVRKWMASGRVTRRFLFRTSFLSFVHL